MTVNITTATARDALAVPVTALLARSPGGYVVEVAGPGNTRRYVPVRPGIFDDTSGLVQVTGALTPGRARRGGGVMTARAQAALPAETAAARVRPPVPVLELDQVSKEYPGSPPVRALDRVSLAVAAGELTAIVGPSGSGKSTLLHLMGTLDKPTSGTVRVTGLDVAAMTDRELAGLRAARIGFVFQQFFLAEHQTVLGNVADGLLYAGVRRGERRRLAAARAGAGRARAPGRRPADPAVGRASGSGSPSPGRWRARPPVVLADEPTGNLDSATGAAHAGPAGRTQRGRDHGHHHHPRPRGRRPDAAAHRDARRAHHRRHHAPSSPATRLLTATPPAAAARRAAARRQPAQEGLS